MGFDERLKADAEGVFLKEHAEDVVYAPFGGQAKVIKAVIERDRLDSSAQDQSRMLHRQFAIQIQNDPVKGVIAVNKGNDLVSFPVIQGESNVDWRVIEVLHKDAGMWRLMVQR